MDHDHDDDDEHEVSCVIDNHHGWKGRQTSKQE
jgi:hypothetical protein